MTSIAEQPLPFGKYRGYSLAALLYEQPAYVRWLAAQDETFFDPYWPAAARTMLQAPPVTPTATATAAPSGELPYCPPGMDLGRIHARWAKLEAIRKRLTSTLHIPTKIPLFGFQGADIEFWLATGKRCGVFHDVGVGKTPIAIGAKLYTNSRTLVVAPAAVKLNWRKKIKLFAGEPSTVWYGSEIDGPLDNMWHIINYDVFARRKPELLAEKFDFLVLDEAHLLCNPKAARTLAIFGGVQKATKGTPRVVHPRFETPYCMLLTATPVLNHPSELYPLVHYVAPTLFPDFWSYGHRYGAFKPGNLSGLPSKPKNLEELHRQCRLIVIRRTDEDTRSQRPRSLPDEEAWVELSASMRVTYRKLLKRLLGEWADAGRPTLEAMHPLRAWLNEVKLPLVWQEIDRLHAAEHKYVLFATRLEPLHRTMAHYGAQAVLIDGSMSAKAKQKAVDRFEAGDANLACISIRAGGAGIDGLQHQAHHLGFLDMDWVPALHTQAKGRLDRTGQPNPVQAKYYLVEDTVDVYLHEMQQRKLELTQQITDGKVQLGKRKQSLFRLFARQVVQEYQQVIGRELADADEAVGAAADELFQE